MARPKLPDGRRVPVSFKLTEVEAALVDSLRGETERSVWLRDAAITAAREQRNSGIRERLLVEVRSPGPGLSDWLSPEDAAYDEPAPKQERKPRAKGPCEHRVKPGSYCTRCERLI